jgi:hypothetical protein
MNKNDNVLVCKRVRFYALKDEDAFFEWIKKIDCIENFFGIGDELHLEIVSDDIHDYNLRDLLGLFYRYNIDMKQLKRFLNNDNKKWFKEGKVKGYWYKRVFDE